MMNDLDFGLGARIRNTGCAEARLFTFLAPTGAQETLMCGCLFGSSLSRAVNLHLSRSGQRAIGGQ